MSTPNVTGALEFLSAEEWRQKLAGLVDPNRQLPPMEQEAVKAEAVSLISVLPSLYGDSLDRKAMWERIGNGIASATAKCGGQWDRFLNDILEYIKADPGRVASSAAIGRFIETMECRPKEWHEQFLRYLETRGNIVVVKARLLWNLNKKRVDRLPDEIRQVEAEDGFIDDVPEDGGAE